MIFLSVDVFPLVFVGLLGAALYLMVNGPLKGELKTVRGKESVSKAITFDDVGGQDTAIRELKESLEFILRPKAIVDMGIRPLKGILLVGPPGTGKTLLAKAAANYTSSSFVAVSGSEFIEMYAGVGAKRVRQVFAEARKKAKREGKKSAIIFIDELEILGAKRGRHQSHLEYDQTLNQLLVEMDGLSEDEETRILVIGATNRADMLDPALTRPGRFDRQVMVGLPDKAGRIKILKIHTRNKPLAPDVSLEELGKATFGFSGAQLESLANEAAILALRDNASHISRRYFLEAIDKVMLGEKMDRRPAKDEMWRVCVHESGHAVATELIRPGSVVSLTIVPRGQALGFMRKNAGEHDKYLYTLKDLKDEITVALAGAVSEDVLLGGRSTGAKNDFAQAWNMAKEIVKSGMSDLGVIAEEEVPSDLFFQECKKIIRAMEAETRDLVEENKARIMRVAGRLREEETLDRESFVEAAGVYHPTEKEKM